MKLRIIVIFIAILGSLNSCKKKNDTKSIANYIKQISQADQVDVIKQGETIEIVASYPQKIKNSSENLASILVFTAFDTAHKYIEENKLTKMVAVVKQGEFSDTFTYSAKNLPVFRNYIYASQEFFNKMLSSQVSQNYPILDTSIINYEHVMQINALGGEIISKLPNASITIDGFNLHLDSPKVIQVNARIENQDESLPLSVQYNLKNGKMFYFGVNDYRY